MNKQINKKTSILAFQAVRSMQSGGTWAHSQKPKFSNVTFYAVLTNNVQKEFFLQTPNNFT